MGTGYNTEVLFNDVRYHVQTEDKGAPKYEIVSHVYQGGAILLTKRLSYQDRPADASRALWTQEMTTTQHKDILRILQQGGLELLRAQIAKERDLTATPPPDSGDPEYLSPPFVPPCAAPPSAAPVSGATGPGILRVAPPAPDVSSRGGTIPPARANYPPASGPVAPSLPNEPSAGALPVSETLALRLVSPPNFRAGQPAKLEVLVTFHPTDTPMPSVKVIVQIFGMSFRPILFSGRTDKSGLFVLEATLPSFRTGQASLNILAISERFGMAELKYEIKRA